MMMKSETIDKLATALSKAQGEFPNVPKDANNPFFKSRYSDLADNVETARPILAKYGLSVSQLAGFDVEKSCVTLTTLLMHSSGEYIGDTLSMPVLNVKAQEVGSGLTYARRYAFQGILCLASADDDGNAASGRQEGKPEPPITPPKKYVSDKLISEPQGKRFFAIANKSGATLDQIKALLKKAGYEHSKDIRMADYETLCGLFESGQWAEKLGDTTMITKADIRTSEEPEPWEPEQ